MDRPQAGLVTLYDSIASFYDPWSRSVTEDVGFYVDCAVESGGPVVELAVGTGRIAVPDRSGRRSGHRRGYVARDARGCTGGG